MTPDSEAGPVTTAGKLMLTAIRRAQPEWTGAADYILAIEAEAEAAAPSQPVPSGLDVDVLRTAARRAGLPNDVTVADIENLAREYDKERLAQALRDGDAATFTAAIRAAQPVPSGLLDRLPPATCYRQHTYESDKHLGVTGAVWKADVLRALAATAAPAAEPLCDCGHEPPHYARPYRLAAPAAEEKG